MTLTEELNQKNQRNIDNEGNVQSMNKIITNMIDVASLQNLPKKECHGLYNVIAPKIKMDQLSLNMVVTNLRNLNNFISLFSPYSMKTIFSKCYS